MTKLMFCQPLHCLPSITKVVRKKYNKAAIEYGLELCRYPNRFHFFLFFFFFFGSKQSPRSNRDSLINAFCRYT